MRLTPPTSRRPHRPLTIDAERRYKLVEASMPPTAPLDQPPVMQPIEPVKIDWRTPLQMVFRRLIPGRGIGWFSAARGLIREILFRRRGGQ